MKYSYKYGLRLFVVRVLLERKLPEFVNNYLTWSFIIVVFAQKLCQNLYEIKSVYGPFGRPESRRKDKN